MNVKKLCNFITKLYMKLHSNSIVHFSAFTDMNAGDYILVLALKRSIEKISQKRIFWKDFWVHNKIDAEAESIVNSSKMMIVGGGGLFLKDTNANNISGWQLPITIENLNNIKVPIFMLAVGYNRFRNQDDFEPCFKKNINFFVDKAQFIGLRNSGSVRAIKSYLKPNLQNKIKYHPCPTTIISKIYKLPNNKKQEEPFVAINCAFDRSEMRYGARKDEILYSIAKVAKLLSKNYKIKFYVHVATDVEALDYFDKYNVDYDVVYLNKKFKIDEILQIYTTPSLVIGMRGHAQMIPFGCKTPILSIISHDKMKWFLEDINHPEWGVDVNNLNFEKDLYDKAKYLINNSMQIRTEISKIQDCLYDITYKNIKEILHIAGTRVVVEKE